MADAEEPDQEADEALQGTQAFFSYKRAAAVLKHAILAGYVVPFASKTGSASTGNRVVVVDGYAGAGRYDDGQPGSPPLIASAVGALQGRTVECLFVERDAATFERLRQVLAEEDGGRAISWHAIHGTVEEHLQDLLSRAAGVPLLLFLDPFGLGLPSSCPPPLSSTSSTAARKVSTSLPPRSCSGSTRGPSVGYAAYYTRRTTIRLVRHPALAGPSRRRDLVARRRRPDEEQRAVHGLVHRSATDASLRPNWLRRLVD